MDKLELRTSDAPLTIEQEGRKLYGHAIVYGSDSRDLGGFIERFLPGSVSETIKAHDIRALLDHDSGKLLGRQSTGTLKLSEDHNGLAVELEVPDTSYARDMAALMKRGDIRGMSFGFRVAGKDGQRWSKDAKGQNVREITRAHIDEVSVVGNPAYPATSAAIRSLDPRAIDTADIYGIDLDALAKIFVSVRKGIAITSDESELAKRAVSLLGPTFRRVSLEAAEERAASLLL